MYQISNRERDDLIKVLTALREEVETGTDIRKTNMKRVAGLLIRKLEKKKPQQLIKSNGKTDQTTDR